MEKWINKRYLHESTVALIDLGLVEATILRDTPTGSKAYKLTPLGQKIVSLIEQMEKEFEDYHRKVSLPEDAGEFINEPLEEE
ncbi:hypothetical protein GACE_0978 [Geoglobus acetivorans]|uniref:HTH hxlR-type domain-containing protein n=1 Tax=Geoglobus acetivorans TaxID=565033 RepID=A0A0A7GDB0_GEOAI|nr:hypothetical protein GACE_0978 [Geoglobus acetivorans]